MKHLFRMKTMAVVAMIALSVVSNILQAQEEEKKTMDIYGFIMLDGGYNFNQIQGDWYDVIRTTKLPSYKNQYSSRCKCYEGTEKKVCMSGAGNYSNCRCSTCRGGKRNNSQQ